MRQILYQPGRKGKTAGRSLERLYDLKGIRDFIMYYRKTLSAFVCMSFILSIVTLGITGCFNKGIKIDEQNFPDETFRNYLLENHDPDGNKYITGDQMLFVTSFSDLSGCENLKGIEYFSNLQSLRLIDCKDLSAIESLPLVNRLYLEDCPAVNVDFSKMTGLIDMEITNCVFDGSFDLTGLETLNEINIEGSSISKMKFTGCPVFDRVYVKDTVVGEVEIKDCAQFQYIQLDQVPDLRSFVADNCPRMFYLNLNGCPDLNELVLRKCDNLMEIYLCDCKIKEVDVRECQYICKMFNTEGALRTVDYEYQDGYVRYGVNDDPLTRSLKLPIIRIVCPSDTIFITS